MGRRSVTNNCTHGRVHWMEILDKVLKVGTMCALKRNCTLIFLKLGHIVILYVDVRPGFCWTCICE